jgi:alpha-glucosidase
MGNLQWWQREVIYQLFTPSFQDSDGDGMGDLRGVIDRLDYLSWFGVGAVWLSPFFPTPFRDFGYDISDYHAVGERFGTMADFEDLLAAAHERGLRVLLDLVPNHSADQHAWFRESRASRHNPRRDWYMWADPRPDGSPPTNWLSVFGGSAWELDPATGQHYYHSFLKEQPDLNWRNPAVREAMYAMMRFWLDKGVDGFRVDATWYMLKDEQLRDNPPNPDQQPGGAPDSAVLPEYSSNQPQIHPVLAEMRQLVDGYDERLLSGELYLSVEEMIKYYGAERPELHLPYNLRLTDIEWSAPKVAETIAEYQRALPPGAWPTYTIGSHDRPRVATRAGAGQTRVAAMLLLTLPGTPTVYMGDEIGVANVPIPPERVVDPQASAWPGHNRDEMRTPMRWDGTSNAGFSAAEPWLPVGPEAATLNVAAQRADPRSLLQLYRRLIALRRDEPGLVTGEYAQAEVRDCLLVYRRRGAGQEWLVALGFGEEPLTVELGEGRRGRVVLSTHLDREGEAADGSVRLRGGEGLLIALGGGT